jgi:hypothetical protein
VAKKHPRYCRRAAGGELLAASGRGLHFDPHPSQGRGTKGCPVAPEAGMASSSARISSCDWLSRPSAQSEPQVHRRHQPGADDAHETHAAWVVMIAKEAASIQKGLAQRHLEVPCTTLVSLGVSERWVTSSSMTAKPILAYSWRTTASHAEQVERTMIFLSSSSSQFT